MGHTFLINWYRSSGISGARPVWGEEIITPSVCETKQRHGMCMCVLGVLYDRGSGCFPPFFA